MRLCAFAFPALELDVIPASEPESSDFDLDFRSFASSQVRLLESLRLCAFAFPALELDVIPASEPESSDFDLPPVIPASEPESSDFDLDFRSFASSQVRLFAGSMFTLFPPPHREFHSPLSPLILSKCSNFIKNSSK